MVWQHFTKRKKATFLAGCFLPLVFEGFAGEEVGDDGEAEGGGGDEDDGADVGGEGDEELAGEEVGHHVGEGSCEDASVGFDVDEADDDAE